MIRVVSQEFVLECEEIARERRGELGLGDQEALDPRLLAREILAIDVITVEHFRALHPEAVGQLTERDAVSFNAVTVFCGSRAVIVVNPSQGAAETAVSVAHEIAHIELEHERLEAPLFDDEGHRRSWHPAEEFEAEYLAREMLVPRQGLRPVLARLGGIRRGVGAHFGVPAGLIRQRLIETEPAPGEHHPGIEIPEDGLLRMRLGGGEGAPAATGPGA
jgi:Zn-dependent peptidase ImmA (M78 family)